MTGNAFHSHSIALAIRRSQWVTQKCQRPAPRIGGYIIAPFCIHDAARRAEYQALLHEWYHSLSPDARKFLGDYWAGMCDPPQYNANHRRRPLHTPTA